MSLASESANDPERAVLRGGKGRDRFVEMDDHKRQPSHRRGRGGLVYVGGTPAWTGKGEETPLWITCRGCGRWYRGGANKKTQAPERMGGRLIRESDLLAAGVKDESGQKQDG